MGLAQAKMGLAQAKILLLERDWTREHPRFNLRSRLSAISLRVGENGPVSTSFFILFSLDRELSRLSEICKKKICINLLYFLYWTRAFRAQCSLVRAQHLSWKGQLDFEPSWWAMWLGSRYVLNLFYILNVTPCVQGPGGQQEVVMSRAQWVGCMWYVDPRWGCLRKTDWTSDVGTLAVILLRFDALQWGKDHVQLRR